MLFVSCLKEKDKTTSASTSTSLNSETSNVTPRSIDANSVISHMHENNASTNAPSIIDQLVEEVVQKCKDGNFTEPTEILRVMQSNIVLGRNLEVENAHEEMKEGDTLHILVDRDNILETAFEELKIVNKDDLRKTLQVDFYGEV